MYSEAQDQKEAAPAFGTRGSRGGSPGFRIPGLDEYLSRVPHPRRIEGGGFPADSGTPHAACRPLISIISVVYNAAGTLERMLSSVQTQDFADWEHILVDGGSTDGTLDILRRQTGANTRWISEPDRGIYDAMNKGVALSRGEWILFLNADDMLAGPGTLASLASGHLADGTRDLLMGSTRYFLGERILHVARSAPELAGRELCINHTSTLHRRSLFERFGLYTLDFKIISDNEWFFRVLREPSVRHQAIDDVISHMSLEGLSDRRWADAYLELHRMRRAYGMPAAKAWPMLAYQCVRTLIRRSLEKWGLTGLVRLIRNRVSRINRYD